MAQKFNKGDIVYVLDYKDKQGNESWAGPYIVVVTQRQIGYDMWSRKYVDDPTGSYLQCKQADKVYPCRYCEGTGSARPTWLSEEATYRAKCIDCRGTGTITVTGHQRRVYNRKDKVVSEADYAPIALRLQQLADSKKQGEEARELRKTTLLPMLVEAIQNSEDPVATAAEFIYKWGGSHSSNPNRAYAMQSELYRAASTFRAEKLNKKYELSKS